MLKYETPFFDKKWERFTRIVIKTNRIVLCPGRREG